jgi:hypothetical protein
MLGAISRTAKHPLFAQPAISLALTGLALLLLVLVLLSVPGPIKGLYWFSVAGEDGSEPLSAGVLGWCSEYCYRHRIVSSLTRHVARLLDLIREGCGKVKMQS